YAAAILGLGLISESRRRCSCRGAGSQLLGLLGLRPSDVREIALPFARDLAEKTVVPAGRCRPAADQLEHVGREALVPPLRFPAKQASDIFGHVQVQLGHGGLHVSTYTRKCAVRPGRSLIAPR